MSYTYTSRAEYEEYTNIMKILRNKCKELNYLTKVIENIPHIEVITDNSILNNQLYVLEYGIDDGCKPYRKVVDIYSFNKHKLEKIQSTMDSITNKMQNTLREMFSKYEFKYHSQEDITIIINRIGYDGGIKAETPMIKEVSNQRKNILYKQKTKFRPNRHNRDKLNRKNRLRIEKPYEPQCSICGDGGCPHCMPHLFY